MTLKKHLLAKKAQAIIEYFLLLLAIVSLTLLSLNTILPTVQNKGEGLFQTAVGKITDSDNY